MLKIQEKIDFVLNQLLISNDLLELLPEGLKSCLILTLSRIWNVFFIVFVVLNVAMQSLLDMLHYTFEHFSPKSILNRFIRYPIEDSHNKLLLLRPHIDLLHPNIIQLNLRSLPQSSARVQKVGHLNNQLYQSFKMQPRLILPLISILHIAIQCWDAIPMDPRSLCCYIFDKS